MFQHFHAVLGSVARWNLRRQWLPHACALCASGQWHCPEALSSGCFFRCTGHGVQCRSRISLHRQGNSPKMTTPFFSAKVCEEIYPRLLSFFRIYLTAGPGSPQRIDSSWQDVNGSRTDGGNGMAIVGNGRALQNPGRTTGSKLSIGNGHRSPVRTAGGETGNHVRIASNEMCTFLILNISSLQLIPVNMIAYRAQYGSADPARIIAHRAFHPGHCGEHPDGGSVL